MAPLIGYRDPTSPTAVQAPTTSSFPQQGSLDWTAAVGSFAQVAWRYLTRLSNANVDVETVFYCRYLGEGMRWSSEGQKRFDAAFMALQHVKSISNSALWFGFGVHHASEILTDTDTGSVWVAVCACLVECYGPSFVPAVFLEMTMIYKQAAGDSDRGPSLLKWRTVTDVCAGILAKSNFGEFAEELMQLDGQDCVAGGARAGKAGRPAWCRGVSSPKEVAQALVGLSELTLGKYQQITICGRADACIIAAIAAFVFDVSFEIIANDTQETLRPCESPQQPRLIVLLEREKALGISEESLKCIEKVYLLKNATPFVQTRFGEQNTICSSRVPWKSALSRTFPKAFHRLMEIQLTFGLAIGSAARIFQAIAEADKNVPEQWLLWCRTYNPQSYGRDYANFIVSRFPELKELSESIDEASRVLSFDEAARNYEGYLETIANVCGCYWCKYNRKEQKYTYCLRALTETIIRSARYLGGINSQDVRPMRSGLEKMYYDQISRCRNYEDLPVHAKKTKYQGWRVGFGPRRAEVRIIEHMYTQFPEPTLLAIAERIFSGGVFRDQRSDIKPMYPVLVEKDHVSAIRSHGLCYYLQAYHSPQQDAASASTVHVLPGEINWEGRPYPRISDGVLHSAGAWIDNSEASKGIEPKTFVREKVLKQMEDSLPANIHLEVTESLDTNTPSLHSEWGVIAGDVELSRLGLSRTAYSILRNSRQVTCSRVDCEESAHIEQNLNDALRDTSGKAYWTVEIETTKIYITKGLLSIRFVAAHGTFNPIVQETECLSCCVLTGMRKGLNGFAVIRPDPSFDIVSGLICQPEDSFLRRSIQNAEGNPLLLVTLPSRTQGIEGADGDGGDGGDSSDRSQSPKDLDGDITLDKQHNNKGSGHESSGQESSGHESSGHESSEQESSVEGESAEDEENVDIEGL